MKYFITKNIKYLPEFLKSVDVTFKLIDNDQKIEIPYNNESFIFHMGLEFGKYLIYIKHKRGTKIIKLIHNQTNFDMGLISHDEYIKNIIEINNQ